jgi:acyl carrier protein
VVPGQDGPIERSHITATFGTRPLPVLELTELVAQLSTQGATSVEPTTELSAEQLYAHFADLGIAYGPAFQRVRRVTRRGGMAVGEFSAERHATGEHLPPTVLDCALQTVASLADTDEVYLAVRFGTCQLLRKPRSTELRCLARLRPAQPDEFADAKYAADLVLLDGDDPVFVLRGLGYKRVAGMPVVTAPDDDVTVPAAISASGRHPARRSDVAALRAQPLTDRETTITVLVRSMIADALHFDPDDIEADAQFVELGLDSLAAVALKNSLETALGTPLAASITFDHPTVRLLARFLDRQLAPEA